jgi:AAA domain, putative AbiEii toxin, Type IV TA system
MDQPKKNIFALWDQRTGEARIALQTLASRPPEGFNLGFADAGLHAGSSLDDLARQVSLVDRVLVVHPPDEALVAVAFETGIAIGHRKHIAILELSASGPLAYAINVLFGATLPETAFVPNLAKLREQLRQVSWHAIPLNEEPEEKRTALLLCPREGIGQELRDVLVEARPTWSHPVPEDDPRTLSRLAATAQQLLWVLVPDANPRRPWGNVLSALAAGVFYGAAHRRARALTRFQVIGDEVDFPPRLEVLRESDAPRIPSLEYRTRTFEDLGHLETLLAQGERPEEELPALTVQRIEIRNFKNIDEHFPVLDLAATSSLGGNWTCIAGINGSGKTAILQALALALLGPGLARELGGQQLRRMLRRDGWERTHDAVIHAHILLGEESVTLSLELNEERFLLDQPLQGSEPDNRLSKVVIVAYGSSRNLSAFREDRYDNLTPRVRRQMTLFDSRARLNSVELLLDEGQADNPALGTLRWMIEAILGDELKPPPGTATDRFVLGQSGIAVEAIDLPDGFRSTVAWLADLCAAWHEVTGSRWPTPPSKIRALVLLDEIDLHLHPSLQRALVPRLREALPNVQFIVTTHSPLVLSSFDRNEIIALDRSGGVRTLDRDVLGFSADQIYEWLMETPAHGVVIEEKLRAGADPKLALYLEQSPKLDEAAAEAELDEMDQLMKELLGPNPR